MNDLTFTIDLLYCLLILLLIYYCILRIRRPTNYPPGPKWLPVVGNSPLLKRLSILHGGFHKALVKLSDDYKSDIIGLKLGSDFFVVVFSKKLIKQVFTDEEFQARPDSYFIRLRTMGSRKGITMTDGEFWQEQRNFATRHLRNLGFGKFHMESLILEELQELTASVSCGSEVALHKMLAPCVLNVLWALTAGHRFSPADPQLTRLLDLMTARARAFDMAGGVLSQLPLLAWLAPEWSGYNIICELNNELNALLQKTIEEHKQTLDMDQNRDFIDVFIKEIISSEGHPSTTFTEEQLAMVCLDFFIAGSQTTSNTLSFALLNMIIHQDIQEQVFEEIRTVLGDRKVPSLEDRCRLPFVEAVLLESQRYLHVVPVAGPRRVLKDTKLNGFDIPKNATVLLSLYSMHHDESLWDQPMKFWPERFLDKSNQKLGDELFQFAIGRRRCLGEALAKNFLFLFFTGILRNFHLRTPPGEKLPTLDPIPGITLSPKPYTVSIRPRD